MTVCITERCSRELRDWELAAAMLICRPCHDQMRHWLQQIPAALIVLRDGSMQRERTGDSGGRGGTRTAPLPCREDVLNLIGPASTADVHDPHADQTGQRPLVGVLGDWVRVVCEERRLNGPAQWTPEALAAWLLPHLGWCSQQQFVDELHRELRDLTWHIRSITRTAVRTRPVSRPCPHDDCGQLTLTQTDGDLYTRCSNCGRCYTASELNDDAAKRAAAA
ncbi:hypothetical protein [Streptomyces sp. NPDC059176]|uniref:hypothetical protein n=1 Tax=Streptomyces sp. NPDC059176 TaxID=3346758 RepID=UPI0036AEDDD3